MHRKTVLLGVIFLTCLMASQVHGSQFYKKNGEIYDSWGICRTRAQGEDGYFQITPTGFRPIIVFESFGKSDSLACRWGEEFLTKYPDYESRAKKIFELVKNKIDYTHDIEQFRYQEFAQNADELIHSVREGSARGDCEDYAILLATLYKVAGYKTAIALVPGHTAALVYLPEYKKTNAAMKFNGEKGWVWVEATGKNNYFGWVPSKVLRSSVIAYEIRKVEKMSLAPETGGELVKVEKKDQKIPPFLLFLFFLWIFPFFIKFLRAL